MKDSKKTAISDTAFHGKAPKNTTGTFYGPDHYKVGDIYDATLGIKASKVADIHIHVSRLDGKNDLHYSYTANTRNWNKKADFITLLKRMLTDLEQT